ncbi:MAG: glycosyltransferase family 4 protein [Alphaproteobacteria bacterium]
MTRVLLFRDFVEDRRISMERFADQFTAALGGALPEGWQLGEFRPHLPRALTALPLTERHRLRLARYLGYPLQALRQQGDINHVLEHGYGHLSYVLPPARTVVTVHDIIPLLRWKGAIRGVAPGRRPWLSELSVRALRRAAQLIAVSENTRRDLIRHIGCDPLRVSVIYPGLDPSMRPSAPAERRHLRARLDLPGPEVRLVLITGESFYKNQETSLAVIRRLGDISRQPVILVRLGQPSLAWQKRLCDGGLADRVVSLAPLSDQRMVELYNAVDCLLFPSWYEGFGLPAIEAMACGTPVVASNAASLPEAIGDAAPMAAPDDVGGLAELVRAVLEDPALRQVRVEKGLRQAARFSWQHAVRETLRVYEKVLAAAAR